jgi:hypothetical protein
VPDRRRKGRHSVEEGLVSLNQRQRGEERKWEERTSRGEGREEEREWAPYSLCPLFALRFHVLLASIHAA